MEVVRAVRALAATLPPMGGVTARPRFQHAMLNHLFMDPIYRITMRIAEAVPNGSPQTWTHFASAITLTIQCTFDVLCVASVRKQHTKFYLSYRVISPISTVYGR